MEHPASLSPGYTWRAAALVAAAIATLELVLLVVILVAVFAKPFGDDVTAFAGLTQPAVKKHSASPGAAGRKARPKAPVAKLPRSQTSVLVLNGNGVSGAADQATGVVRSLEYLIAGTANAPRSDFARSLIMYRPGFRGEAIRLGHDVRVKRVVPLDGMRAADLQGAHVALILGRN